ncbi:MAG: hypothetical protein KDG50_03400 [Chromatiales bacterium]|nr:hypothetical protein [Chromatiales bacterium]
MQTIRGNLTRLKKSIEEKLPDDDDVFGYPGINKGMLIAVVDDAYQLSYQLAELEPKFEITLLKRKMSHLIDDCKEYLSKDVNYWGKEKKFDKFLSDLTKVREEIRITYLVVVDKGLRTESDAQRILSEYKSLSETYESYYEQLTEVQKKLDEINETHRKILEQGEESDEILGEINEAKSKISNIQTSSESSFQFTSKYESEAKERRQSIVELESQLRSIDNQAEDLNEKAEKNRVQFQALKTQLEEQMEINNQQQAEIQNTLENANRMGMAGSFKMRKEELNKPIMVWGVVFVVAVIIIFAIGYHFVGPYVAGVKAVNYFEVGIKVLMVSPFVWLAWMSVKQFGYLSRIREDYAYKYASAMAFEGYKKHAVEIDEDLLKQLLQVSIDNLSLNPIRLFNSKDNHATPANELLKDLIEAVKPKKSKPDVAAGEE